SRVGGLGDARTGTPERDRGLSYAHERKSASLPHLSRTCSGTSPPSINDHSRSPKGPGRERGARESGPGGARQGAPRPWCSRTVFIPSRCFSIYSFSSALLGLSLASVS